MVLAAHSEYFRIMIDQAMKQNTQEIPVISVDSDMTMISDLLQYMYTGRLSVSSSGIEKLCHQAEKYSMSRLVELCKKLKGISTVKPEVDDRTSDSSIKLEDSVPIKWEYNSQETPQYTNGLYYSELGGPTSDISNSGDNFPEDSKVGLGVPVSSILDSEDTIPEDSKMDLGVPVSDISDSEDTIIKDSEMHVVPPFSENSESKDNIPEDSKMHLYAPIADISDSEDTIPEDSGMHLGTSIADISKSRDTIPEDIKIDLGAAVTSIFESEDTITEDGQIDLGIVKQEVTDSAAVCEGSSKSVLFCNTIENTLPSLSPPSSTASQIKLPENKHLDNGRFRKIASKRKEISDNEDEMVCNELVDSDLRRDSGLELIAQKKHFSKDHAYSVSSRHRHARHKLNI